MDSPKSLYSDLQHRSGQSAILVGVRNKLRSGIFALGLSSMPVARLVSWLAVEDRWRCGYLVQDNNDIANRKLLSGIASECSYVNMRKLGYQARVFPETTEIVDTYLTFVPTRRTEPPAMHSSSELICWAIDTQRPYICQKDNFDVYCYGAVDLQHSLIKQFLANGSVQLSVENLNISTPDLARIREGAMEHGWTFGLRSHRLTSDIIELSLWAGTPESYAPRGEIRCTSAKKRLLIQIHRDNRVSVNEEAVECVPTSFQEWPD